MIFFELGISTCVLKIGLCWGPDFLKKVYLGKLLNFFKLYSWSFVFESIKVTIDLSIKGSQKFKINFSDDFKPPSIYMAPTIASKQSLIILSVDLSKFLWDVPMYIYFFKLNFLLFQY